MPSIPGLDARETAVAVWAVLIILYVALRSGSFRNSAWTLLKMVFASKLTLLFLAATAYLAATVAVLQLAGYWDGTMAKTTVLWFVGTGLVTMFSTKRKDGRYFARLVRRNLSAAALLAYLMNIHPFPLYVWLPLLPIVLVFAGTLGLAEADPEHAAPKKPSEIVLTLIGLTALAFSLDYVAAHLDKLTTGRTGKEFLLPLVLTVCFVPSLYAIALVIVYDGILGMTKFGLHENNRLYRFARRAIVGECGVSLGRGQQFEEEFRPRLWSAKEEKDVACVMNEFRRSRQRRKSTPRAA
jgi:hypothetical protein